MIPPLRPDRVAAIQARYDASTPGHWHLDPEPHTDPDAVRTTVDGWHHGIGILQFRGWKADENRQFVLNARDDIGQLLADRERYVDRADLVSRIGELELALGGAVGMLFSASVAVSAGLLPDLDRLREGAEELRQVQYKAIGKDTGDAVQAPAGESTQAGPDLFSIVLAALSAGQGPVLPLPAHTARLLTARVTEAVTPLVRYRPVWDAALPPGGYVCNICGDPVESEPCPQHKPANAKPQSESTTADRRERYAAALRSHDPLSAVISVANDETDPVYTAAYSVGRSHAGAEGWRLDSFEAVIATSDGSYGAAEEYRCRKCGAIGAQGTTPKSLLDLMAMAARHECLPPVEGGGTR